MNAFQQMGILAPLVRYDDRYARAIGKVPANSANANRLFYSKYLPIENPGFVQNGLVNMILILIAYEAVRQYKDGKKSFCFEEMLCLTDGLKRICHCIVQLL